MRKTWTKLVALGIAMLLALSGEALAQRGGLRPANPQTKGATEAPAATGKVVAYEAGKSIALETTNRNGMQRREFKIDKDQTKIELPPRIKEIAVGQTLSVWALKETPDVAARIGTGGPAAPVNPANPRRPNRGQTPAGPPIVAGQVVAYEADKSLTIEVRQRGGQVQRSEFAIANDQTKVEFVGEAKALAVGIPVTVTPDKDNAKLAARIVAGAAMNVRPQRGNRPNPNPNPPNAPAPEAARPPVTVRPPRPAVTGLAPRSVAEQIDRLIHERLAAEKIPASPPADDAEFIRRLYLDVVGVIPPTEKVVAFISNRESDKRARLIDELLASEDYGRHFADVWCDRINVKDLPIYREPFCDWMSASLNAGRGWDEIVLDMLTAEGSFNFITRGKRLGSTEPQALFLLLNTEEGQGKGPNPAWLAGESGRLFLGVQLQCAECHDHPFTASWKQTDFWGLAAFYSGLKAERPQQQQGLRWVETPATEAVNISIPATALKNVGQTVPARLLGSAGDYKAADSELLRQSLARWMTAADNPYFPKATANRVWAHFFGRGLINPVDDIRPDNPCSHPKILQLLGDEAKRSQFDVKHLIRCLCLTAAYQRTSAPVAGNQDDAAYHSHVAVKTMGPGVFYDSLKAATGWAELKLGLPERKTKLTVLTQFTPREVFVDFFRAAQGEEASPLDNDHGIPQALKLMNAAQLSGPGPVVQRLAAAGVNREQAVEQLYLTALARPPSSAESALVAEFLAQRNDASPEQGYAAVLWTLINCAEFVSNH